jgi:hypothetical protein
MDIDALCRNAEIAIRAVETDNHWISKRRKRNRLSHDDRVKAIDAMKTQVDKLKKVVGEHHDEIIPEDYMEAIKLEVRSIRLAHLPPGVLFDSDEVLEMLTPIFDDGDKKWLDSFRTFEAHGGETMFRGTNAWRLAMCYESNDGILDGAPSPLRVGDENKGYGSPGISAVTAQGLSTCKEYSKQSVALAEYLPGYDTILAFKALSEAGQREALASYAVANGAPVTPIDAFIFSQLIRRGWHLVFQRHLVNPNQPGPDIIIDEASVERIEPRQYDDILTRCKEFCRLITTTVGEQRYTAMLPFTQLAVVAEGIGINLPFGPGMEKGGGFLPDESRFQYFKVLRVHYVSGQLEAWEKFKRLCPKYKFVDAAGERGATSAFVDVCMHS